MRPQSRRRGRSAAPTRPRATRAAGTRRGMAWTVQAVPWAVAAATWTWRWTWTAATGTRTRSGTAERCRRCARPALVASGLQAGGSGGAALEAGRCGGALALGLPEGCPFDFLYACGREAPRIKQAVTPRSKRCLLVLHCPAPKCMLGPREGLVYDQKGVVGSLAVLTS